MLLANHSGTQERYAPPIMPTVAQSPRKRAAVQKAGKLAVIVTLRGRFMSRKSEGILEMSASAVKITPQVALRSSVAPNRTPQTAPSKLQMKKPSTRASVRKKPSKAKPASSKPATNPKDANVPQKTRPALKGCYQFYTGFHACC